VEEAVIRAHVPLTEAEASLAAFWRQADDDARARGRAGALRFRALNLLVIARDLAQVEAADRVLEEVTPHHPARVVIFQVGAARAEPGPLQVDVSSATCLSQDGIQQVCREQIAIPVAGSEPLDALAEPLLLSDAPVVLWLPVHPDLALAQFGALAELADRVILDTATLSDPLEGLRSLATLLAEPTRDFTVTDLNWARLTPWRELTADLFDDPRRRPLLARVRRLQVSYASRRSEAEAPESAGRWSQAAAALLYVGWLAASLGWSVAGSKWRADDPGFSTTLASASDRSHVADAIPLASDVILGVLQPRSCKSVAEEGLETVVLEAGEGEEPPVVFSLTRTAGESPSGGVCATRVREGTRETQMRTMTLPYPPVAALLGSELDYLGRDRLYEEALLVAARLAALPGVDALAE
jgi:glucose-6-phosphate dehydrogenase assembly protein OpcA